MATAQEDWPMFGQNNSNTASSSAEISISTRNVKTLKTKWTFQTGGDVSARAAVVDNVAYFPDWAGNLFAVNTRNGKLIWGKQLSSYGLVNPTYSRSTPAVVDGVLYIGVQQGAWMLAINAATGHLLWKTQLETVDPLAIITTSPTVVNGMVFEGVASTQEAVPGGTGPARGSVVALSAWNGTILWKTYTTPAGYTGAGVWGSNPVVDLLRGTVYVGTGDNYSAPTDPAYLACISAGGTAPNCQSPHNLSDSIIALDMFTGHVKWSQRMQTWNQEGVTSGSDFFNLSCLYGIPGCPSPAGPDFDFGSAPNEITYFTPRGPKTIIGAGQKSGLYYAFDPDTGRMLWQTQVGPGSALGGMEWGSATDGSRIYVAVANFYGIPWGGGSAGFFAALDPSTGSVLWKAADPNGSIDLGPLAVSNGVVYAPSMGGTATAPNMLALDAATGKTLWTFPAGASVIAGATVSNGSVYWGSGYTHLGLPGMTGGTTFYAFTPGGN
jgi:polyvinyl alcohol dehydrogenase (cytochrome)